MKANNQSVSATVNLTSTYVAVTFVRPALEDGSEIEIHGRNANSDGQETDGRVAFNPVHGTVIVTPENASYADNWEITSDNETIGYYNNGSKVYVPKQAGTVKYTATLTDMNPNTGEENTVTGTSTVTYKYKNPLTEIKVKGDTSDFSVKAQESEVICPNRDMKLQSHPSTGHLTKKALQRSQRQKAVNGRE